MKAHFVKQSFGKIWCFFHNRQGICYSVINDYTLSAPELLVPNGQSDFDVIIDHSDCIHLVLQDEHGDVLYYQYDQKEWTHTVVMKSKTPSPFPKHFSIQRVNNWLNLLYQIEYEGRMILAHQIVEREGQNPEALDYMEGHFAAAQDSMNNLYVLYRSQTKGCLGVCKYVWSQKKWEPFEPVDAPSQLEDFTLFFDQADRMHIAGKANDEIVYIGEQTVMLGMGKQPIFVEKNGLFVMWHCTQTEKIKARKSEDGGNSFQNATEFIAGRFVSSNPFGVRYTIYETGYTAQTCYGYIDNKTPKLYLLNDFFALSKKPPQPIQKSVASEAQAFARTIAPDKEYFKQPKEAEIGQMKTTIRLEQMSRTLDEISETVKQVLRLLNEQKEA